MSGKPNMEGVRKLSEWLRKLHEAKVDIRRLELEIDERMKNLAASREAERVAKETVERLMQEMDVHAPGNAGYEGRMLWLLRELNIEAERYGRTNP